MKNAARLPELLAPAGSSEALRAAVAAGADAVYLGGTGFNARANAVNFQDDAISEAVAYCHAFGGMPCLSFCLCYALQFCCCRGRFCFFI